MSAAEPAALPDYVLVRRRRRTIGLVIRDDGTLEVRAPLRASRRELEDAVRDAHAWIARKQTEKRARSAARRERRWQTGDEVPYRGGALRLEVVAGAAAAAREGDLLTVPGPPAGGPPVRAAVVQWLLGEAREAFHAAHVAAASRVGVSARRVVIKDMRSRWGSCGPARRMSLNWRLILAPPAVLDYVLVHELCHVHEPNHSDRFWARVASGCPDYRRQRDWLGSHGAELDL